MSFWRRCVISALVSTVVIALTGVPAFAVHDTGDFELDGDATASAAPGTDWSAIWNSSAPNVAFVVDGVDATDTTYFKGGGSKDINDVTDWKHSATDVAPDKDEITNAYAYAVESNGEMIVYFGADRYSNDGDATIGFWFFQDDVAPLADGSFSGTHQVNDVFIVADFTNGGVIASVKVYIWNGTGLTLLATGGDCATASAGDAVCARVNPADGTPAPWPYAPKPNVGSPGAFPARTFIEGGVNLSDLFGTNPPCFSSFLAETRSSQETTAQLKDFAGGEFDTCASKSGTKFEDLNGDGDRDEGEPGIEDWQIHIFGEGIHLHDTTDADGAYSFTGLEPGDYVVCEQQQGGWTQSYPSSGADCSGHGGGTGYAINLDTLEQDTGNDFGNFRNATKSGTKFHDIDGDGVRDAGEAVLEGWTINLDGTDGGGNTVSESDTTDANGAYSITVPPGVYEVCETQQEGWTQSYPTGDGCWDITLTSNETDSGNDFGNFQNATKSGTKFQDTNANGVRDEGEAVLSGWQIHLYGTSGAGDAVHEHDTTNASGDYSISVPPGDYTVCESLQEGWTQSLPGAEGSGIVACGEHGDGLGYSISLTSGQEETGNDFGNFQVATKSGTKFEDLNADGDRDEGEPGLGGWTITIDDEATGGEVVHQTALTDETGHYEFQVEPGDYIVCEVQQEGWSQSMPGGDGCYHISLDSGELDSGNDFGNYRSATKQGTKFEDLNADGDRDAGEPGVAGVQVHLFGTSGAGDSVHEHDTTDSNGAYSFSVAPGSYTVCETVAEGWTQSYPGSGADCSGHGGGVGYAIELSSNETDSGNDFGNFRNANKEGTKFEDLNADGTLDEGEPGVAGVQIHLFGTSGAGAAVHEHDTTDANGGYSFTVEPGNYTVCETITEGWTQSYPASGADCSEHGGGVGYTIELTSNETDGGNNFGNFRNGTKEGTKFEDLNADGDRDEGEPGVEGVEIHLFGSDGLGNSVHQHDTTDANGAYSFNVSPGNYTVCETIQEGWTQSHPQSGADCGEHGGGLGYDITLTSNGLDSGNDFGNYRNATKAGTKFDDLNGDGDRDEGEPGVAGVEVHLFGSAGGGDDVHEHAITDENGAYAFDVPPGNYTVCETIAEGWTQSYPSEGADCTEHGGGIGYTITLTSGGADTGNDFGNFRNATKQGTKFNDLNRDGIRDEGEPGLGGWEIHIFGTDGRGNDVHEHTTTADDGSYSLSVPPGGYTVCETAQSDVLWVQSFPTQGADCSGHGGGLGYAIVLTSGQVETGNDFGNFLPNPDIQIVKLVSVNGSVPAHTGSGSPGDTATYTFAVTNTGEVTLYEVSVDDDKIGHIGDIAVLEVGETVTLSADVVLGTDAVTNIAIARGHDVINRFVDDDDTDTVTVVLGSIVVTGTNTLAGIELGFALMAIGVMFVRISRRRRPEGALDGEDLTM